MAKKKAKPTKGKKLVKKAAKKPAPSKKKKSIKRKSGVKKAAPKKKSAAKKPVKKVVKKTSKKSVKKAAVKKTVKKKTVKKTSVKKAASVKKPVVTTIEKPSFVAHATSLKPGMIAPHFQGVDQHGTLVKSSELIGKTVLLYFYPKDDTPGCTAEACSLRDEFQHLNDKNIVVLGVSGDDIGSHKKFAEKFNLPFSLLADTDHSIIRAYDVWGNKQLYGKVFEGIVRTTFVIDADGVIKHVVTKVDTANHAQQILNLN